jgi:hypothetical protein
LRQSLKALAVLTLLWLPACSAGLQPAADPDSGNAAQPESGTAAEAISLAVLRAYLSGGHSEGNVTLEANRLTQVGEQRDNAGIVLMTRPRRNHPNFSSQFLDRLVRNGVVAGLCGARDASACPDSITTSFLHLSKPRVRGDSATQDVWDEALNPAACRAKAGASMGGVSQVQFTLARDGAGWRVVRRSPGLAGSTVCGSSPEEEAYKARWQRELATLRSVRSPMAGTYRVVVTFSSGDSSVLYSRTEPRPMSGIRERRMSDFAHDDFRPIIGYYLAACSAATIEDLPPTYYGKCLQTFYAVSAVPIDGAQADTVWRGEIDPLVEVTFIDPRQRVRDLAHSLFGASEEQRADDWYFLPGRWITAAHRAVRFEWDVKRGNDLLYSVRAERISSKTLKSHSR